MSHNRLATRAGYGSGGTEAEVVRVWLLGGFWVSVGSRVVEGDGWGRRKAGSLTKLLALSRGHSLHRDHAMETLWPVLSPGASSNNLHLTLHAARRMLGSGTADAGSCYLRLHEDLLTLCADGPLWVDIEGFEEAAAIARRSREPDAYRMALELYAGELVTRRYTSESPDGRVSSCGYTIIQCRGDALREGVPSPAGEARDPAVSEGVHEEFVVFAHDLGVAHAELHHLFHEILLAVADRLDYRVLGLEVNEGRVRVLVGDAVYFGGRPSEAIQERRYLLRLGEVGPVYVLGVGR